MQKLTFTCPSQDGIHTLQGYYYPAKEPRFLLQLVHGMAEWTERYEPFIEELNQAHISVIAHDHLGHGNTAILSNEPFGYFTSEKAEEVLVEDVLKIGQIGASLAEDLPFGIFAHSMGSFITRIALIRQNFYQFAIIMGTSGPRKEVELILPTAKKIAHLHPKYINPIMDTLSFGAYRLFIDDETFQSKNHWLSHNEKNVAEYDANPKLGFTFTNNGFFTLFKLLYFCNRKEVFASTKNIPIFLMSGIDDPVGNYGKGVLEVERRLTKAKKDYVVSKLYPDARHEILNEEIAPLVTQDMIHFIYEQGQK